MALAGATPVVEGRPRACGGLATVMARALSLSVRLATGRDCVRLARMSRLYIESGLRWRWRPARIRGMVQHPDATVALAERGDDIAGFAVMVFGDKRAHLTLLAVAPAHRRRGIARALIHWLIDSCRTAGMGSISLEVRQSNADAQAFYASLGFRQTGLLRGYYDGREHAVAMRLELIAAEHEAGRP